MDYVASKIRLRDGIELQMHYWSPDIVQGTVLIIHGYAEHGYRYEHVAREMCQQGLAVYAIDLRGHGKSGGLAAYVDRFDDYLEDLDQVLEYLDRPLFLFGHSMGGLIMTKYLAERGHHQICGLITSGAAISSETKMTPIQKLIVPLVNRLVPKLPIEKLDITYLSRDPDVKEAYINDPLVYHGGIRVRFGVEMLDAIAQVRTQFHKISIPLLAIHGTEDGLIPSDGTQKLYHESASDDKQMKLYDGLYHELVNEPEKAEIISEMIHWIKARI